MKGQSKILDTILLEAIEIENASKRKSYLDRRCGIDTELREDVEKLITDHFAAGDFLEQPVVELPEDLFKSATAIELDQEMSLNFLAAADETGVLGWLDDYAITEIIGRGGMGIVLKGRDRHLNRTVAIKVLAPECRRTSQPKR